MSKKKIIPMANQLLLRGKPQAEMQGDIIIPETVQLPVRLDYIVMGIGKDIKKQHPQIKMGSKVIIKKNHGCEINLNDTEYLLIPIDAVEAIICARK